MARRGGHSEEELPFVALMDTMTNVVGVLIIVLVMVGIGLARSVNKVLSELPPVTVEEHAKLKKELEQSKPKNDPVKVDQENAKLEEDLKKSTETLKTLDLTTDKQQIKMIDVNDLQKQLEAKKKERDTRKTTVEAMLAEVDKLKARLDTTPVYRPPPSVVVKLPNPRAMPEKAEIHRFLVAGGKILYIDEEAFLALAEQELKRGEANLTVSRDLVKGPDGKTVMVQDKSGRMVPQKKIIYDPKKITDHFTRLRFGSRDIKVEVAPNPNSPRVPVKMIPAPSSGETIDQAKTLISAYQTTLKKLKINPKAVVWFHVFKDSIETYLQAREIADQMAIPVGWELYGNNFFVRNLPNEFEVAFTPRPPGPTSTVNIAPPKTTLD